MSEPAAVQPPDPDTTGLVPSPDSTVPPMPYPGATTGRPLSSAQDTIPPMPWETADGRAQGSAPSGRWRTATMPLRKMMRRTPSHAV
jgi:hypothetical protein